ISVSYCFQHLLLYFFSKILGFWFLHLSTITILMWQ
ncbi:unnamed protein product, partial [Arabidopsis halleri]